MQRLLNTEAVVGSVLRDNESIMYMDLYVWS